MNPERPVLIILHGGAGSGPAEQAVARVRAAAARAAVHHALEGGFEAVIVATDNPSSFPPAPGLILDPDPPALPFDFHARVAELVARFGLTRPAVMGGGALPLATADDFAALAREVSSAERVVVTNNFFSSDLTAWTPGEAFLGLTNISRDNVLPRRLRDQAGLRPITLPRGTRLHFDLDTPCDLAVLALQEDLAPALAAAVGETPLPLAPYRRVMRILCDPAAELVVTGRVGSAAWSYLETETACRVRMLSEERGLAAAGPTHRARSVLGFLLEAVGIAGFFERVCALGDAIVIDTRVIEAHLGLEPSREDRFQSDLLNPAAITDPFLREFTAAAAGAAKPVLLGGHSLVSGGLMALTDAAWLENDRVVSSQ